MDYIKVADFGLSSYHRNSETDILMDYHSVEHHIILNPEVIKTDNSKYSKAVD